MSGVLRDGWVVGFEEFSEGEEEGADEGGERLEGGGGIGVEGIEADDVLESETEHQAGGVVNDGLADVVVLQGEGGECKEGKGDEFLEDETDVLDHKKDLL